MQWPDATAGAVSAAEAEARQSGFEAFGVVEQGGAASTVATLFNSVSVPNGLDLPCTEDPELFFAEAPADVEAAKALCQGCRARVSCLEGALERREPWGVWGGELLLRGVIVPRKRPRGRPRKDDSTIAKADGQAALSDDAAGLTFTQGQARAWNDI
jgi:WhiB family redox-sensing transcriptional regulator